VPVKAYPAIATLPEVGLHQLHAGCGARIEYRKFCPRHGQVPAEEITKGYPYQFDVHVELSEAELEQLQPADDKTIRVHHFLDPILIDLTLLSGRSLYLAPAHPAAGKPLALVLSALEKTGKWGLGRVVLSGRWQIVVVRPAHHNLFLHTLYHPAQCRAKVGREQSEVEITPQELRPVLHLIDSARGEIDWDSYRDDTEQRLTRLVQLKLAVTQESPRRGNNSKSSRAKARTATQATRTSATAKTPHQAA
jgi:DNA end-binding protein Ku